MHMLPPNHPATKLLDLAPDEVLPANALDDLGNVRMRKAVAQYLGATLAKA
jgi:hypothetical protein